jgi:hypothetical protein
MGVRGTQEGKPAAGEHEAVEILASVEPRPLLVGNRAIAAAANAQTLRCLGHANDASPIRDHILVQEHVAEVGVAPVQVRLVIIVDEHGWVDIAAI